MVSLHYLFAALALALALILSASPLPIPGCPECGTKYIQEPPNSIPPPSAMPPSVKMPPPATPQNNIFSRGECYYDVGAKLHKWRKECKIDRGGIYFRQCWTRAPRLDRCCDPNDYTKWLKKVKTVTCVNKDFEPYGEAGWMEHGKYPPW